MTQMTNNFSEWISRQVADSGTYALSDNLRSASLEHLKTGVFPTRKDEEWRYTPLSNILNSAPTTASSGVSPGFIQELKSAVSHAPALVFIDGIFSENDSDDLSELRGMGLTVKSMHDLDSSARRRAEETIENARLSDDNIFQHIALGLSRNGLFIEVPNHTELETPLHLINISSNQVEVSFNTPLSIIRIGDNSRFTLVEQFATPEGTTSITVPATYIQIDQGAGLKHLKIGVESSTANHIANTAVSVASSAEYVSHQYLLGSQLTRSNVEVSFSGPDAHAVLRGIYLGDDEQHLDMRTYLDHAHPHCSSDQHFRGILNGKSRGVFNGLVLVREHAQKTDAQQSNKNLLLSRDARIDTKPQLEIFADDVKCAHGATVGELDNDALFYLQSRGIGKAEAALMLTRAFAAEVTQEIEIEALRSYVETKVSESLDTVSIVNV